MDILDGNGLKPVFENKIWNTSGSNGTHEQLEQIREEMNSNQDSITVIEMNCKESTVESSKEFGVTTLERTKGRRSMAGIVYGPPLGAPPGHYKQPLPVGSPEPRITCLIGSDFKKKSANSVLEVLLEEPRVSIRSRLRKSSVAGYSPLGRSIHSRASPIIRQNPKRIRVSSSKLLKVLGSIAEDTGHSFITIGTSSIVCFCTPSPFSLFPPVI